MFSFSERRKRRDLKKALYTLFRENATTIEFYRVTFGQIDLDSGEQTKTRVVNKMKALMYTSTIIKKFENDIGYLAANKNFTYGGDFIIDDRIIIIKDPGFVPETDNYITAHNKRYNIGKIQEIEPRVGYILHVRETDGQLREQETTVVSHQFLEINQDVSVTKS